MTPFPAASPVAEPGSGAPLAPASGVVSATSMPRRTRPSARAMTLALTEAAPAEAAAPEPAAPEPAAPEPAAPDGGAEAGGAI